MKKALFFAGLAAASLLTVGCNKEADLAPNGRPIGIILSDAQTRTVNDGLTTKWVNGDALNVFYAEAGTTTYSNNMEFVVDDAEANHATGSAELTASAYDWYLLYPYSKYIKTPANTSSGYLVIGSKSNETQTQAGLDSKAHLAGNDLPVYGVAKNVDATTAPVVAMKNGVSVVAVNVTNATTEPITVSAVSFTAPEDIVGTYYINFAEDELAFKGSGDSYVGNTAELTVTGDATLAANASAKFYIAIKPFAAKANDKLTVKVHVGDLVFKKEVTLPSAVEFKSGVIKQLNVSYTGASEIPSSSLADIIAMDKDTEIQTQEVLVVGKYARGIMLAQNGTYLLAFDNGGVDGKVGDIVTVSGKVGVYAGLKQIANPVVEVISSDNEVVLPDPKVLDGIDDYASDKVELIQYTGTLKISGNYYNVDVAGSTRKGSIQYPLDTEAMAALNNKGVTATGFFTGITGTTTQYLNMMSTSVKEAAVNVFEVTPDKISVAATATSAEITVAGNVDWTAEASEGATVSPASGNGDGTITVSFPANTDTQNPKEYTVFVRTEATGVNDEFEVDITQAAADVAGETTVTVDFSAQQYENGYEMPTPTTIDGVTFSFDQGDNRNAPKYYTTGSAVRLYGGNSMTVSVPGKTIISITLTFDSGEGTNAITTNVGTYTEPTWTGEAGSVTFTVSGTSGHRRIQTVTVKYKDGGDTPPVVTLTGISVSGQTTTYNVGDTFSFDGTVTATYSDGSTKTVTPTNVSTPDMSTAGTQEVTVTYTEGEITKEAKYNITIEAAGPAVHTIVMADYGSVSFTAGVYSVLAEKAEANNDPVYNATGKDLRVYAKGTLTVSNSKENMTKIVFNLSAQGLKRLAPITASTGTIATQAAGDTKVTWTGNAAEVVFTVGETAIYGTENAKPGQLCFTSMDVAPWSDGDVQPKTLSSIEVSGQKTTFTVGDTFSFGGTVTAVYSDGSRTDVAESDVSFTGYNMSTVGEQTVTVTYQTKTTTYGITVNSKPDVGGDAYTLVSALTDLSAGTFVIAALNDSKYYAVPSTTIDAQTFTCIEGVFDSTTSAFSPAEGSGEFVLTAGPVDNSYYIYNTTLEKYLVATGSKKFGYVDNTSDDYGYWTFSEVTSGGFSGAFSVKHDNKTHYMRAYNNTVRCYDGASNNGVYLFKK